MADYNGWKNRATWNVNLWIFNDKRLYSLWQDRSRCHMNEKATVPKFEGGAIVGYKSAAMYSTSAWTTQDVQDFVRCAFGNGGQSFGAIMTPDSDYVSDADLSQLATVWSDMAIEHHPDYNVKTGKIAEEVID